MGVVDLGLECGYRHDDVVRKEGVEDGAVGEEGRLLVVGVDVRVIANRDEAQAS